MNVPDACYAEGAGEQQIVQPDNLSVFDNDPEGLLDCVAQFMKM